MKILLCSFLALAAALAFPLRAHDLVLIPSGDLTLRIKFGHPQEWELASTDRLYRLDAYAPGAKADSWLKRITKDGIYLVARSNSPASTVSGTWIIAGSYDNGFWVKVGEDTHYNTDKLECPGGKESGHFLKFAKGLLVHGTSSNDYQRRIGLRVELIPMADPFSLRLGQSLPVKALYEGKPMAQVGLEIGDGETKIKEEDIPRYKTDAQGIAQVPITRGGLEVIAIDYKTPSRTPDAADEDNYSSTLTFTLPSTP
jgi:nickel transport protein